MHSELIQVTCSLPHVFTCRRVKALRVRECPPAQVPQPACEDGGAHACCGGCTTDRQVQDRWATALQSRPVWGIQLPSSLRPILRRWLSPRLSLYSCAGDSWRQADVSGLSTQEIRELVSKFDWTA